MADRTGQHLSNYRLILLLEQGGFAETYLGEPVSLNTQAADPEIDASLSSTE